MTHKSLRQDAYAVAIAAISASRLHGAGTAVDTIVTRRNELSQLLEAISSDATRLIGTLERGQLTLGGTHLHEVARAIGELESALPDDADRLDESHREALAELSRRIAFVQPEATLAYLGDAASGWADATANLSELAIRAKQEAQELAAQYSEMLGELRDIAVKLDEALAGDAPQLRYAEREP